MEEGKGVAMKIVSLSGIIGYGFSEVGLARALATDPDCLACDGGSTDPGPYYLGAGRSFTNRDATRRDVGLSLPEAVRRGIPYIIGTAGGSGGEPHLAWLRDILEEVARERKLDFRMAPDPFGDRQGLPEAEDPPEAGSERWTATGC